GQNGISNPIVSPASTWVNLTYMPTIPRITLAGQTGQNPDPNRLPGPTDDFRVNFPRQNATWSDVSLTYFNDTEPSDNVSRAIPVLYAALGTATGGNNNAVFRTENPALSPITDAPTTWYIGDPGAPQNEIEQIKISPWQQGGFYQLSFAGSAFFPLVPGDPKFPMGIPAGDTNPADIAGVLNGMPTIGGIGGFVTVTLDGASAVNTLIFD